MDRKRFALIKYDHGERESLSSTRQLWIASLLVVITLTLIIHRPRQLCIGPRYIICGRKILYYANIRSVTLKVDQGLLVLQSSTGQTLVLDQDKFQTNARKLEKIVANKEARFLKVARKILDRVQRASPDAELKGILHLRATGT